MVRYVLYVLFCAVLLTGCGETPTEPEPDSPDREPDPELVTGRLSQQARSAVHLAPPHCDEESAEEERRAGRDRRTSPGGDCK